MVVLLLIGFLFCTTIIAIFLGSFALGKSNGSKPAWLLFLICLSISTYYIGQILFITAPTPTMAIRYSMLLGTWPLGIFFMFYYVIEQSDTKNRISYALLVLFGIIAGLFSLFDSFGGYYHRVPVAFEGYYLPTQEPNAVILFGVAWMVGVVLSSLTIIFISYRRTTNHLLKRHYQIIALSILFFAVMIPAEGLLLTFVPKFQLTSGVFILGLVTLNVYGLVRYDLHTISVQNAAEVIVSSMPSLVLLTDPSGNIVRANKAAVETLNYPYDKILGINVKDLLAEGIFSELGSEGLEVQMVRGTAEESQQDEKNLVSVFLSATPVNGPRNLLIGHAYVGTEISKLRNGWDQIQRGQWLEAVGRFTEGVAHELNNLFNVITLNSELINYIAPHNLELQESISNITKHTLTASSLIKQLLDYSQQTSSERVPTQLDIFMYEFARKVEDHLPEKHQLVFANELSGTTWVRVDPSQISVILENLVKNALEAMEGGGRLTLGLCDKPSNGNMVCVFVQDTGSGIPIELHQRIFQPLFSTKKKDNTPGIGLGLAQASGLAQLQEGVLRFESKRGQGTTFFLELPKTLAPKPTTKKGSISEIQSVTKRPTILVADDFMELREVLTSFLRKINCEVLPAKSGKEALDIYHEHREKLDLVIVDMVMPDLDGASVFRRIHEKDPDMPVIILTGYSNQVLAGDLLREGLRKWLQKPVPFNQLENTIWEVLGGVNHLER